MRFLKHLPILLLALAGSCTPHRAERETPRRERSDYSVYDVGGSWRDQSGRALALGALRGKPRVLAMMYTHCTAACPIAIATMKRIEAEVGPGVGLVLVSLDPERDTPGALAMYAREKGLAPERWTLLNGGDPDVRALAVTLGVRYRRTSPDDLAHSNAIMLLDATGAVVRQQQGFSGTDSTIAVARELARSAAAR